MVIFLGYGCHLQRKLLYTYQICVVQVMWVTIIVKGVIIFPTSRNVRPSKPVAFL